jgi:hypothetical protein
MLAVLFNVVVYLTYKRLSRALFYNFPNFFYIEEFGCFEGSVVLHS